MAKFHINPKTGEPGLCRAHGGNCPFGSADQHFNSADEARTAYEQVANGEFSSMTPIKRVAVDESIAFEKETAGFDRVALPTFTKETISSAARNLLGSISGAKSYEQTIADAKSRAAYATNYFAGNANSKKSGFLEGQTSVASAAVASRTQDALSARSVAVDSSRVMAHATPAANPGNTLSAIAAARANGASRGLSISRAGFGEFGI